jgi:hypothetical protein
MRKDAPGFLIPAVIMFVIFGWTVQKLKQMRGDDDEYEE